jgi:Tol biopolymer transport system component
MFLIRTRDEMPAVRRELEVSMRLYKAYIVLILAGLLSSCSDSTPVEMTATATPIPSLTPRPTHTFSPADTNTPEPTATAAPSKTFIPKPTATLTATDKPYELIGDLYYVPEGDPVQKLSLYLPDEEIRKPITLLLPSGQYFPELVSYFVDLGYAVVSFNTRSDSYMTEIQDGFCALAWVHANADTYGLGTDQIVPVGGSMWGGNAAILGLVEDPALFLEGCPYTLLDSERVRAVIALAGVFDYSQDEDFFGGFIHSIGDFMGGTREQVPGNWAEASAITWVRAGGPPFLLVHGTADTNVDAAQSRKFASALEETGTEVEMVLLTTVDHYTSVTDERVFEAMHSFLSELENSNPSVEGGGVIAFNSEREGNTDIYIMNADGSDQRRLTDDPGYDAWPAWSPDGSEIAFVSDRSGNADIYVMEADGSNLRQLTKHSANDIWPAWSPDGSRIAFPSRRDDNFEIYLMDANGANLQRLTNTNAAEDFPAWSPDGEKILFSRVDGQDGTFVMNADGSGEQQLLEFPVLEPAWSPDGLRIVFGSDHEGMRAIYVMDADGSNLHRLSSVHAGENCPDWSPDGTQITFASWRHGYGEIFMMDADGGNQQRITEDRFEDEFPAWQPGSVFLLP